MPYTEDGYKLDKYKYVFCFKGTNCLEKRHMRSPMLNST